VEKGDVYQNLLDKKSCGVNPCFCCPHIYMVEKIGFVKFVSENKVSLDIIIV
jgi:hypothetical protein